MNRIPVKVKLPHHEGENPYGTRETDRRIFRPADFLHFCAWSWHAETYQANMEGTVSGERGEGGYASTRYMVVEPGAKSGTWNELGLAAWKDGDSLDFAVRGLGKRSVLASGDTGELGDFQMARPMLWSLKEIGADGHGPGSYMSGAEGAGGGSGSRGR